MSNEQIEYRLEKLEQLIISQSILNKIVLNIDEVAQLTGLDPEELKKVDAISFFGNLPLYSAYSDEDRKKLMQVMKKIGLEPKDYINTGSSEVQDTHVKSPINAFKGYKK